MIMTDSPQQHQIFYLIIDAESQLAFMFAYINRQVSHSLYFTGKNGKPDWPALFVLALGAQTGNVNSGNSLTESTTRGPHFDAAASKNVTALLGKTAYLNCRVKNLANRTVSNFSAYYWDYDEFHYILVVLLFEFLIGWIKCKNEDV